MTKKDLNSGFDLSQEYKKKLEQKGITIIDLKSRHRHEKDYFIGGKVQKEILYQNLLLIRNTNFQWVFLPKFRNTRSYRAIFRKFFKREELRKMVKDRFNASEIEVAQFKSEEIEKPEKQSASIKVILTIEGHKKCEFSDIQDFLTKFIIENYLVICLYVKTP